MAAFALGDYVAAEKSARAALEARKKVQLGANYDAAEQDMVSTHIALALTAQGRRDEAAKILEPVVKRRRNLQSRNHGDMDTPTWLAVTLYAEAAVDTSRRAALLREAAGLIDGTPAEYRNLKTTRLWRDRIAQAQRGQFPWTGRGQH
jgi:tetratricopeptide (TPR) repeat protein